MYIDAVWQVTDLVKFKEEALMLRAELALEDRRHRINEAANADSSSAAGRLICFAHLDRAAGGRTIVCTFTRASADDLAELNQKLRESYGAVCDRNRWLEEQLRQQVEPG